MTKPVSKTQNFELVREAVRNWPTDSFSNKDILTKVGLNYGQTNKFLQSLVEIGELTYAPTTKIYVKVHNKTEEK